MAQTTDLNNSGPSINQKIPWEVTLKNSKGEIVALTGISTVTEKLELYTNIDELFMTGHWVFNTTSDLIDKFNDYNISIGSSVFFSFYSTYPSEKVDLEMSVLKIHNGPGVAGFRLGNVFSLILVSPWYFAQYPDSHAYQGTVSEIITALINRDDGVRKVVDAMPNGARISPSIDEPRPRWQTMQNQGSFIYSKLKRFYRGKGNTASFIFTNTDNSLEALSYADMALMDMYNAIDYSNPQVSIYLDKINDPQKSKLMLYPTSVQLGINEGEKANLWEISVPILVSFARERHYMKKWNEAPMLQPLGQDKEERFTFVNGAKNKNLVTKMYCDDSLQFMDNVTSCYLNENNKELLDAHAMYLVCSPNIFLKAGRQCFINLIQSDNETASLFSQTYIIAEITHMFKGHDAKTLVTLKTTSFNKKVGDTTTLFNAPNLKEAFLA